MRVSPTPPTLPSILPTKLSSRQHRLSTLHLCVSSVWRSALQTLGAPQTLTQPLLPTREETSAPISATRRRPRPCPPEVMLSRDDVFRSRVPSPPQGYGHLWLANSAALEDSCSVRRCARRSEMGLLGLWAPRCRGIPLFVPWAPAGGLRNLLLGAQEIPLPGGAGGSGYAAYRGCGAGTRLSRGLWAWAWAWAGASSSTGARRATGLRGFVRDTQRFRLLTYSKER